MGTASTMAEYTNQKHESPPPGTDVTGFDLNYCFTLSFKTEDLHVFGICISEDVTRLKS